jgi:hypothetical protein
MRVSIWQQFSSNHSGDFVVVGRFESSEAAQKAVIELQHILRAIQQWYRQPENRPVVDAIWEELSREGGSTPMPVEVELGKQHGIEWDEQFPDTEWYMESSNAAQAVVQYQNDVFVDSYLTRARTWTGGRIAQRLLNQLGAQTSFIRDSMIGEDFQVQITWNVPDEQTAERLWRDYQIIQNTEDRWNPENKDVPQDVPDVYWGEDDDCGLSRDGLSFTYLLCDFGHLSDEITEFLDYLRRNNCADIQYNFQLPKWLSE